MTEVQLFLNTQPEIAEVTGYIKDYHVENGLLHLTYVPIDANNEEIVIVPLTNISQIRIFDTEELGPENN